MPAVPRHVVMISRIGVVLRPLPFLWRVLVPPVFQATQARLLRLVRGLRTGTRITPADERVFTMRAACPSSAGPWPTRHPVR